MNNLSHFKGLDPQPYGLNTLRGTLLGSPSQFLRTYLVLDASTTATASSGSTHYPWISPILSAVSMESSLA